MYPARNRPQYWLRQPTGTLKLVDIGQGILKLQVIVKRHHHAAINAVADQRLGQRAGHISQAAGLGKRGCPHW